MGAKQGFLLRAAHFSQWLFYQYQYQVLYLFYCTPGLAWYLFVPVHSATKHCRCLSHFSHWYCFIFCCDFSSSCKSWWPIYPNINIYTRIKPLKKNFRHFDLNFNYSTILKKIMDALDTVWWRWMCRMSSLIKKQWFRWCALIPTTQSPDVEHEKMWKD